MAAYDLRTTGTPEGRRQYYFGDAQKQAIGAISLVSDPLGGPDIDQTSYVVVNKTRTLTEYCSDFILGRPGTVSIVSGDADAARKMEAAFLAVCDASGFWPKARDGDRDARVYGEVYVLMLPDPVNGGLSVQFFDPTYIEASKVETDQFGRIVRFECSRDINGTSSMSALERRRVRVAVWMEGGTVHVRETVEDALGSNVTPLSDATLSLPGIPVYHLVDPEGSVVDRCRPLQEALNKQLTGNNESIRAAMFAETVLLGVMPLTDDMGHMSKEFESGPNAVWYGEYTGTSGDVKHLERNMNYFQSYQFHIRMMLTELYAEFGLDYDAETRREPSAKSILYNYVDLIQRSDTRWGDWNELIRWTVDMVVAYCRSYPDIARSCGMPATAGVQYRVVSAYVRNLPEDEAGNKEVAMKEYAAGLMSRETYVRKFSEDPDIELARLKAEAKEKAANAPKAPVAQPEDTEDDLGGDPDGTVQDQ